MLMEKEKDIKSDQKNNKTEEDKTKKKEVSPEEKVKNLEDAGLKMIVMSMTSSKNDKIITKTLKIPTIAFRSSSFCNGEVELLYDLLGISTSSLTNKKRENDKMMSLIKFNKLEQFIKKIHARKI